MGGFEEMAFTIIILLFNNKSRTEKVRSSPVRYIIRIRKFGQIFTDHTQSSGRARLSRVTYRYIVIPM